MGHVLKICFGTFLMYVLVILSVDDWGLTVSIWYSNFVRINRIILCIIIILIIIDWDIAVLLELAITKLLGILWFVNALNIILTILLGISRIIHFLLTLTCILIIFKVILSFRIFKAGLFLFSLIWWLGSWEVIAVVGLVIDERLVHWLIYRLIEIQLHLFLLLFFKKKLILNKTILCSHAIKYLKVCIQ